MIFSTSSMVLFIASVAPPATAGGTATPASNNSRQAIPIATLPQLHLCACVTADLMISMYPPPVYAWILSVIGSSVHFAMNILTYQLLKIEARFGIAYCIPRLERIAAPSRRQGQEFLSNDAPRLDGRKGVRIELDSLVDRQFHLRTILDERNPSDPADFDAGNFDRRTRFEPRGAVELRLDFVDVAADHLEFPELDRQIREAQDTDEHEHADYHFQLGFFHPWYSSLTQRAIQAAPQSHRLK